MFTRPDDLSDAALVEALATQWNVAAANVEYRPVGFGSHHWLALDATGANRFVTVDDLTAKLWSAQDTTDSAFDRLEQAFSTAAWLHDDAGLDFVVAPLRNRAGRVLHRLDARYAVCVHPHVGGVTAGADDEFTSRAERRNVLDLLVRLHRAGSSPARTDDFAVPNADALAAMLGDLGSAWDGGPYAKRAHDLLSMHAREVETLVAAANDLRVRVAARPDRMVTTHGEPKAGNTMLTSAGFVLVDWDSVLLAPPERDLWDLTHDDPTLLEDYARASGAAVDRDALAFFRLWYDLAEIGGYLSLFRAEHTETADAAGSWENLQYFCRPVQRWPALFGA